MGDEERECFEKKTRPKKLHDVIPVGTRSYPVID